ncbi:hypothetical protein SDC9_175701 [bioreactor metagenome]|uniref:Uncharacterized protein n=1 Tax=bioreactor metagenome TaxID=1076179 RepID=A0A645GPV7_9ZZZZ
MRNGGAFNAIVFGHHRSSFICNQEDQDFIQGETHQRHPDTAGQGVDNDSGDAPGPVVEDISIQSLGPFQGQEENVDCQTHRDEPNCDWRTPGGG